MKINEQKTEPEHWKLLILLLKKIAEKKHISHQQIANDAGFIKSNVTRFFGLRYKPSLDMFLRIAQAVKVNFFIEDKDSDTELNKLFEDAMAELERR